MSPQLSCPGEKLELFFTPMHNRLQKLHRYISETSEEAIVALYVKIKRALMKAAVAKSPRSNPSYAVLGLYRLKEEAKLYFILDDLNYSAYIMLLRLRSHVIHFCFGTISSLIWLPFNMATFNTRRKNKKLLSQKKELMARKKKYEEALKQLECCGSTTEKTYFIDELKKMNQDGYQLVLKGRKLYPIFNKKRSY